MDGSAAHGSVLLLLRLVNVVRLMAALGSKRRVAMAVAAVFVWVIVVVPVVVMAMAVVVRWVHAR